MILADGRSFQSGESLRLIISLSEEENTRQIETATVVRRIFDDPKSRKRKMTIEYTGIARSDQQFLLQYCIRRQLNKRRKARME